MPQTGILYNQEGPSLSRTSVKADPEGHFIVAYGERPLHGIVFETHHDRGGRILRGWFHIDRRRPKKVRLDPGGRWVRFVPAQPRTSHLCVHFRGPKFPGFDCPEHQHHKPIAGKPQDVWIPEGTRSLAFWDGERVRLVVPATDIGKEYVVRLPGR